MRQINQYQKTLDKLNRVVDESIMQIRKNIQKDKVDRVRAMASYQGSINGPKPTIEELRKFIPRNRPTLDD